MHAELVIEGIVLPDPDLGSIVHESGFVAIDDGRITALGPMTTRQCIEADQVHDGTGCLLMPGLCNQHCHAAMVLFRGLADDLPLMPWLHEHIFPAESTHVDSDMVYWSTLLAASELLLSGTTLVADAYFFPEAAARAYCQAGLRAVVCQAILDFPSPDQPDPNQQLQAAERFLSHWQGRAPLIQPALFAHSPYTCSNETLLAAKTLARRHQVPLFLHAAETRDELSLIAAPQADSPIRHLDALGLLDPETILIHAVWCDEADLDCIARSGAQVVTCPQSNCKLASGIAPLSGMLKRSIPVGLGTDGAASNNGLDLFREMDACAKLQKIATHDPVAVPAQAILQLSCQELPALLGLTSRSGLAIGCRADLMLIDLQRARLQPFHRPDLLVYAAAADAVRSVYIRGQTVVEQYRLKTLDVDNILNRIRRLAAQVS